MDMMYSTTIEEDGDDCMIPLSDEILDTLGWYEGDILEWIVNDDNTITIKKAS
jgi:bifunctional DNA-binding transcriptional regulator/antitoxin component of YhaV-PrlF toxin-antitoxin module